MGTVANRYCSNCGHELSNDARFCPSCGRPVHEVAHVPTPEADVAVPPPPNQHQASGSQSFAPTGAAPQQRSLAGRLFVGCAGLIVLAVLFVGCLALIPGGGGDETAGGGGGGGAADKEDKQNQEDQKSQEEIEKAQQEAAEAEKEAQEAEEQQAEEERKAAEEQERQEEAAAAKKAAEAEAAKAAIGETVRAGDAEWTVTNATRRAELRQKGFGQFGESKQGDFVVMDFTFTNLANDAVTLDTLSLPLFDSEGRQYEADTDTFGYIPVEKDIFLNQVNPGVTQEGQIIYSVAPGSKGFTVRAGDLSLFGGEEAKIALGF